MVYISLRSSFFYRLYLLIKIKTPWKMPIYIADYSKNTFPFGNSLKNNTENFANLVKFIKACENVCWTDHNFRMIFNQINHSDMQGWGIDVTCLKWTRNHIHIGFKDFMKVHNMFYTTAILICTWYIVLFVKNFQYVQVHFILSIVCSWENIFCEIAGFK